MSAALPDDCFLDRRAAPTTGTLFLIEGAQTLHKFSARAVHTRIHHVDARAADGDRASQHLADRAKQAGAFVL